MAESTIEHVHLRVARVGGLPALIAGLWAAALTGIVIAAAAAPNPFVDGRLLLLAILVAGGFLTETFAVRLSDRVEVTGGAFITVVAAVLLGPLGAAIVGFAELLPDLRKPVFMRWLAHAPLRTLCGLAAGTAALVVQQHSDGPAIPLAATVAAIACLAVDALGNCAILTLRGASVRDYAQTALVTHHLPFLLYLPAIWLVLLAQERYDEWAMALILAPALLSQFVYTIAQSRIEAEDTLTEANLSFAIGLIRALEASDAYTAGHSAAVGVYARDVALELGYSPDRAALIQLAALLHDVGKIGVPTEILQKPARLTDGEWLAIQRHPGTGAEIVREVPVFRHVAEAIRHHHERPDGRGYPDGLVNGSISQAALVIGATDAYSAMTQPRAYREARHPDEASAELARWAGSQFDCEVVDALLRVLARQSADYRLGEDDRFSVARQRADILSELGRAGALRTAAAVS